MKKHPNKAVEPPSAPEYDFSRGVVGKYAARYAAGTNLVLLDPDIAHAFPDAKSVNDALRSLVRIADRQIAKRS